MPEILPQASSFGHVMGYDPSADYDFGVGYHWVVSAWPYMMDELDGPTVVMLPGLIREFTWDVNAHGFPPCGGYELTYSEADNLFTLTAPNGDVWQFIGFKRGTLEKGRFRRLTGADGSLVEVDGYTGYGHITQIQSTYAAEGGSVTETYNYAYTVHADRVERLSTFTLTIQDSSGTTELRKFTYTYTSAGNLQTVTAWICVNGQWIQEGTHLYAYDAQPDPGETPQLTYVLHPQQFAALAADPQVPDPLDASEEKLAQYALYSIEYNDEGQVSKIAEAGRGDMFYERYLYQTSGATNAIQARLLQTRADGWQRVLWRNRQRQAILEEVKRGESILESLLPDAPGHSRVEVLLEQYEPSSSAEPTSLHFYHYDDDGRLTLHATPSALAGYTVTSSGYPNYDTLVEPLYRSQDGQYTVGLVHVYDYYKTTDLEHGAVAGQKQYDKIKQGRDGTPIKLRKYEYTARNVQVLLGGQGASSSSSSSSSGAGTWIDMTIYPVVRETAYRNEDGTGEIVTEYSYEWYANSVQMLQRTTTLPAVPTSQNGSGVSATRIERFDERGNLVWLKDERGFLTYHEYNAHGHLTQTIQDVDGSQLTLPEGWSTPSGGGLHLVTDYEVDSLGRTTQVLGPEHESPLPSGEGQGEGGQGEGGTPTTVRTARWTVYKDADRETWTAQGYATGAAPNYTYTLVNPVSISKETATGLRSESIQAVRASSAGKLSASDTFAQSSYCRWSVSLSDIPSRVVSTRRYHTIPATGEGSPGTNYDETTLGYDALGRQNRQETPGGTITRTVHNVLDQAIGVYVGTDDTCATDDDPTGRNCASSSSSSSSSSAGGNNMVLITESEYAGPSGCTGCSGGGGSGQLVRSIQHVDSSTTRTTEYMYDWRNRQEFLLSDHDAQDRWVYSRNHYNNLDEVIRVERYHDVAGDGPDPDGGTHPDDILIARAESDYDDLGRPYRTRQYAVNAETGAVGDYLQSNTWYDAAGNTIKQQGAGTKQFTKTIYDGVGRPMKQYVGYDVDETAYADAASVSDDTILEQTETTYDASSSAIFVTYRRRFHNATGEGELTTPSGSQPKARVSYVGYYQDAIGRSIATANYGTNGGTAPTRSSTIPTRSDDILVNSTEYDDAGMAYKSIDPMGREDRQFFDALGRVVKTVQNYKDGVVSEAASDEDLTVETTYNADGLVLTLTAKNPTTGDQTTRYVYGTTLTDSAVARSDRLRAEVYPDSDDTSDPLGNGTDGVYDRVEYRYNRQGERIEKNDQNETVHVYEFDSLGRLIHDRVTSVGDGIDDAARRISTTYEVRGMVQKITSYDDPTVGSGTALNEVVFEYNDYGLLVKDYQEHGGTKTSNTPYVGYNYDTTASSGVLSNGLRPTSIRYPNGRLVHFTYATAGATNDALNRVAAIAEDNSGSPGNSLAEYNYLGLASFVQVDYPEPDIRYDLAYGTGDDPYAGLDRFDRVVDLLWRNYGASTDAVRIQHGYDRAGNRLWREDPVAAANGVNFDELYAYDGMYQLTHRDRGDLNANHDAITSRNFAEAWTLDMTGNWPGFQQDADGNGTWDLDQTRTHDAANEITAIADSSSHVSHDRAGNMTRIPKPDNWSAHFDLTYDAWNRLVTLRDGETTVAEYAYDGRNYRVTKTAAGTTCHYYYSTQWQVLEERVQIPNLQSLIPGSQQVWGLRYIDDLILRDRDADADPNTGNLGLTGSGLEQRLYALQDPNWNMAAIAATIGTVQERYTYSAYGKPTFLTGAFGSRVGSSYAWDALYTGRELDVESGLGCFRNRPLGFNLGRFLIRDPAGPDDLGSEFAYVGNNPLVRYDPFGLQVGAPGAWATCYGPPSEEPWITGRGKFTVATLGPLFLDKPEKRLGSTFFLKWSWTPKSFLAKNGCCCCDRIGFAQVKAVNTQYHGDPNVVPPNNWEIDGALPYGPGDQDNPCATTQWYITLPDNPNAPANWKGVGANLKYNWQRFWTCVVCLKGIEGIVRIGNKISGIAVYGCIYWESRVVYEKATGKYLYHREIMGAPPVDDYGQGTVLLGTPTSPGHPGVGPSLDWITGVEKWTY